MEKYRQTACIKQSDFKWLKPGGEDYINAKTNNSENSESKKYTP